MKHCCPQCGRKMYLASVRFKGQTLEAFECSSCGHRLFTEKQLDSAITNLESRRLKESYRKRPIRIGHSWAVTLPKDIVEVFGLDKGAEISLHPDLRKRVIEMKCSF